MANVEIGQQVHRVTYLRFLDSLWKVICNGVIENCTF